MDKKTSIDPKLADIASGLSSSAEDSTQIQLAQLDVSQPALDQDEIGRVAIPKELYLSRSESHIEIIDGLLEGQEIVKGPYRAISKDLENGSSVEVNNSKDKFNSDKRK